MAKTIKFNLILDDKPVRTIGDLRENFSIEDILELYNNGLLQRWLEVRGYSELLEKVKSINEEDDIEIITKLITIFQVEIEAQKVKEGIAILEYINERKIQFDEYNKLNFKTQAVIDDYHSGYRALIDDIIENADDMAKIKADIKEIEKNYIGLFDLNFYDLYFELIDKAPLSVFAILMNNKLRTYFINELNEENSYEDDECAYDSDDYEVANNESHTEEIHRLIKEFIQDSGELIEKLGEYLKVFNGETRKYWKPIESKGKKYMIIKMEEDNFIRNLGKDGEEYEADEVNGKFIILNGIDYMSNYEDDELLYMEV